MKQRVSELLEKELPLVDLDSDYLFSELDSLSITLILMVLSDEFGVEFDAKDATPKNLKSLDSIVKMIENKLASKTRKE